MLFSQEVLKARDNESRHVPIFLKISPDLTDEDIKSISNIIKVKKSKANNRVDGIIISNTTISRPESLKSDQQIKSETGGLSGRPLATLSTLLIEKFYKELQGIIY